MDGSSVYSRPLSNVVRRRLPLGRRALFSMAVALVKLYSWVMDWANVGLARVSRVDMTWRRMMVG